MTNSFYNIPLNSLCSDFLPNKYLLNLSRLRLICQQSLLIPVIPAASHSSFPSISFSSSFVVIAIVMLIIIAIIHWALGIVRSTLQGFFKSSWQWHFIDANTKPQRNALTCFTVSSGKPRSEPNSADFIAQVLSTFMQELICIWAYRSVPWEFIKCELLASIAQVWVHWQNQVSSSTIFQTHYWSRERLQRSFTLWGLARAAGWPPASDIPISEL